MKGLGHTVNSKLIQMLTVDIEEWRTFSAEMYEIGANWILCCEQ